MNRANVRPRAAVAAVALLTVALIGVEVQPAHASLGSPLTALFIDSEVGDFVGAGQQFSLASISATGSVDSFGTQTVTLVAGNAPSQFVLEFRASRGHSLSAGSYNDVHWFGDESAGGIFVRYGSRDCGSPVGRFIVDQVTSAPDATPTSFSARFEQHCSAGGPGLFGAVTYNATADYRTVAHANSFVLPGTRPGHTSSPRAFTITNGGPSSLTVTGSAISGNAAADFNVSSGTCGSPLAAQSSCALNVTFSPHSTGTREADLVVFDEVSPSSGSGYHVRLSGLGGDAPSWVALDGAAASDPAAVAGNSMVRAFATNQNGQLRSWTQTSGTWGAGANVSLGLNSGPSASIDAAGSHTFARWYDGTVVYFGPDPGSNTTLGGQLISTPEAASDTSGLYVFGVGTDHALWYRRRIGDEVTGLWSSWQSLGGYLTSNLATSSDSTGLYVFGRGGDNSLWYQRLAGGVPSGWRALGGLLSTFPAAASDGSGTTVFVRGVDGALWSRRVSGSPTGWTLLGGYLWSAPDAVADESGMYVFAVGGDHAMWYRRVTASPTAWASLGGYLVSNPAAAAAPVGGNVQVIAVGGDSHLWARTL